MRLLPPCTPKFATRRRPERETFGLEVIAAGVALGQPFMPWQRDAAMLGGEIDQETGLPAYRELVITVPRQQGKTVLHVSFQVQRCTSPRWAQPQRSAFTAQSGKDARDKWLDEIFPLLRRSKKIRPLIRRIYEGMGNEYVAFRNGSLIRLLSTSTSSGQSKTLHQAVLDEIWHDADWRREQGLRPAMLTVADAQLLSCSTAGTAASVVLNRKVEAGRKAVAADTGRGIAYIEYSAPDGWDPDDEGSYFGFMPALCPAPPCRCGDGKWRHTVTLDVIRSERASMEPAEFARAYGNVPDKSGEGNRSPFDVALWAQRADPKSRVAGRVALGFQVRPDLSAAAIAIGGRRLDGLGHGELVDHRPGTGWLVGRLVELAARWDPCVTVLNASGQSVAVLKDLAERGFDPVPPGSQPAPGERRLWVLGAREYAQACGALVKDVADGGWRHLGQAPVDAAVEGVRTRPLEDAYAWSARNSVADICPLEAVTVARHGFAAFGTAGVPSPFALWG